MLNIQWIDKRIMYTGGELRPRYAYLEHGVVGNSLIAFRGPCRVSLDHMVDGEDFLQNSKIQGDDMVHFIFELFNQSLFSGVLLQRLFASIVIDVLKSLSLEKLDLQRKGDDIYWGTKKLSISVATCSVNSVLIHFAVNVSNEGTPVETCCLDDFSVEVIPMVMACLKAAQAEHESIMAAIYKVKSV